MPRLPAAILGLAMLAASAAVAQQGAAPQTFRSSVDIVHLDVSVLDRDRRPVRGLTAEDFTVTEDGTAQKISVFQAVDVMPLALDEAPWTREVAPEVQSNAGVQDRRLFLILIDDSTLQADLMSLNEGKEAAQRIIDRLGPNDLASVVFTLRVQHSQEYTSDRARLRAAVDTMQFGFRDMGNTEDMDAYYFVSSVGVLHKSIEVMSTMPDRRKSILYLGQGVPVDLSMLAPASLGLRESGGASDALSKSLASEITRRMLDVFELAARANVNVYTVDVCGVRVDAPPDARSASSERVMAGDATAGVNPLIRTPMRCSSPLEADYLRTIAEQTGGRAIVQTNDVEPGLDRIFEENESYYLLGYQPTNSADDGKLRRLKVSVNRPGVQVRTRSSYKRDKASDAAKRRTAVAGSPLRAAMSGVLPRSDVPLRLTAVPFPIQGRREAAVAIAIGVEQPVRQQQDRRVEPVDLQVSAFRIGGKHVRTLTLRADVTIRESATGTGQYEVLSRMDLPPGRYHLRAAAHVRGLGTSGSVYYDVDVPDYRRDGIHLTSLVLTALPRPVVSPANALQGIIPVLPTTRRTFGPDDQVGAYLRVVQSGKSAPRAVALRIHVRDTDGNVVQDVNREVSATLFARDRTADVGITLPVRTLAPGEYLLRVNLVGGETPVWRDSRFTVGEIANGIHEQSLR